MESFRKYQLESAWVWEHQALTRARFSAGDPAVGEAFEKIRCEVLCQQRDLDKLRADIVEMRQKMMDSHATRGDLRDTVFDLKHDPGGLVDVEFIVQYLVLGHSHAHPELTGNKGNIALLKMAADAGLIPGELAETVRNAYRDYRRMQHGLRLNGTKARVAPGRSRRPRHGGARVVAVGVRRFRFRVTGGTAASPALVRRPAAEGSPESRPFARRKANQLALRNPALTPHCGAAPGRWLN
jgi:glutamate-ammonia-ligase adenylyltransferase